MGRNPSQLSLKRESKTVDFGSWNAAFTESKTPSGLLWLLFHEK